MSDEHLLSNVHDDALTPHYSNIDSIIASSSELKSQLELTKIIKSTRICRQN